MEFRKTPYTGYSVTSCGMVMGLRGKLVRSSFVERAKYERVTLSINGKSTKVFLHRLVAMAWVEGFKDGLIVNHKDGNKRNNHYSNLEWCDKRHNHIHALRNGFSGVPINNKLSIEDVKQVKRLLSEGYTPVAISEIYRVTKSTIYNLRAGRSWKGVNE